MSVSVTLVQITILAAVSPTLNMNVGIVKIIIFSLDIAPAVVLVLRINLFKTVVRLIAPLVENHSLDKISKLIPIIHFFKELLADFVLVRRPRAGARICSWPARPFAVMMFSQTIFVCLTGVSLVAEIPSVSGQNSPFRGVRECRAGETAKLICSQRSINLEQCNVITSICPVSPASLVTVGMADGSLDGGGLDITITVKIVFCEVIYTNPSSSLW